MLTQGKRSQASGTRKGRKKSTRHGKVNFIQAFFAVSIIYVITFLYFFIQHHNDFTNQGQSETSVAYNTLYSSYVSGASSSYSSLMLSPGSLLSTFPPNPFTNFELFQQYFQLNPPDTGNDDDDYYVDEEDDGRGSGAEEDNYDDDDDEYLEKDGVVNANTTVKSVKAKKETSSKSDSLGQSSYLTMYGEHKVQSSLDALPKWFRDYTKWNHGALPEDYVQSKFQSQYNSTKYLVILCLPRDNKCGGLTDRLRPLPFYLFAAKVTSRVLCIHWTKPFPLEYFLIPPKGGIEWRCPAELGRTIDYTRASHKQPNVPLLAWLAPPLCDKDNMSIKKCAEIGFEFIQKSESKFIITRIHKNSHGRINSMNSVAQRHSYKDYMPKLVNWLCPDMMGDMFRVMFQPVPALGQQINGTMARLGLVEKKYVTAHARTRYPCPIIQQHLPKGIDTDKEGGLELTGMLRKKVMNFMINSIHCVHLLQPDLPILFLSDDANVTKEASLGVKYDKNSEYHPLVIDRELKPKHFDMNTRKFKKVEEFYSVFEDLLILGGSKCVSHGIGGFGSLGAGLIGNSCRVIHRNPNGRRELCPNERGSIEPEKIDPKDMLFGDSVGGEGKIEYKR